MEPREQESALILALRAATFAAQHPYLTSGIFGAAVGSVATYKILEHQSARVKVFTPKVYELALTPEDLHKMQSDVLYEVRVETTDATVVVTSEKREPLKQLPVIEA